MLYGNFLYAPIYAPKQKFNKEKDALFGINDAPFNTIKKLASLEPTIASEVSKGVAKESPHRTANTMNLLTMLMNDAQSLGAIWQSA